MTRLRDCKEGYMRMGSPEKARSLERVRGCTRYTSWNHTLYVCRHRWMPCANSQASQWVSLEGSSTVRSRGGGKIRNLE